MTKCFGPWATPASAGSKAHLSAFWKRRLAMLPATHRSSTRLGGRAVLFLLIAAASVWALPTLRIAIEQGSAQAADASVGSGRISRARMVEVKSTNVWCLAFSPDSETMAGGTWDGRLILWDADCSNGEERAVLSTKQGRITAIAFHPDEESVLLAGKEVERWNARTRQRTKTVSLEGGERFDIRAFSPDCAKAVGTQYRTLRVWDAETGRVTRDFFLMGIGLGAALSPDGRLVAVGTSVDMGDKEGKKSGVQVWDLASGHLKHVILVPTGSISGAAFSHDGKVIAGGTHREVLLWDAENGKLKQRFEGFSGPIEAIAFSPDDQWLAAGGQGPHLRQPHQTLLLSEMKVWKLKTGELVQSNVGELGRNTSIVFSPNGRYLARCDYKSVMMHNFARPETSWAKRYGQ